MTGSRSYPWWQCGTVYQIYPRSFQDSNGDGIGDLRGIVQRLDYLCELGVDAIWISPIYPSPMADFGYDIADYCDIHPIFGGLTDFDALIAAAHERQIKVILDFVPNHTSDEHPWFVESRSSRDNPRRNWYIWRDPAPGGGPPNNWMSHFGGSAWQLDEQTGQYYLHLFLDKQPDLNWRNPEVQQAMFDVLCFWFERGVDGFRIDVIDLLVKDADFRDNPLNTSYDPLSHSPMDQFLSTYSRDQPEVHELIAAMRQIADQYGERVLIGEIWLPIERLVAYYGLDRQGLHLPFNFHLLLSQWNALAIAAVIDTYEAALPRTGWPNWVLGNHDTHRFASRVSLAQARVAALLLLTLRGTPTIYYGEELGMQDVPIPPELVQDPFEKSVPGVGLGRDPERTPMQWDESPNAGFTSGMPWLPLSADCAAVNVAVQSRQPGSMLGLYQRLIAIRRREPALQIGRYERIAAEGDLLVYLREHDDARFLIMLNLGHQPQAFDLGRRGLAGTLLLSTELDRDGESLAGMVSVRGDEGLLLRLS